MRILGRKWSIKILCELIHRKNSLFSKLQRNIQCKYREEISARSLSNCLKKLLESHLIKREILSKTPPLRVVYSLTEKGKEFEFVLRTFKDWLNRWEKSSSILCIHNHINLQ
ncbi:MAG: winged helix-turn-helix transcriptional regulator [Candidatus Hodarchaeales archaeon]